jgi:hypothetical protein
VSHEPILRSVADQVGPYELFALAGRGGMGSVYRAKDTRDGAFVALKVMDAGAGRVARFERETRLLRELEHPALARYLDHGEHEGRPYLAMEWLEGEDLEARLARAPLTIEEALTVVRRAAGGLAVAHERSIVHRDVKPSNVFLVDRDPEKAKLIDFGVARRTQRSEAMTRTGSVLGTVGYMAPEQAHGDEDIDPRADVFALGCVMFECLTGRPAYSGPTPIAVLAKVLTGEPVPLLRELRADAPEEIEVLLARMLARERDERPADASVVRLALEGIELPAHVARSTVRPPDRSERRIISTILVAPDATRATLTPDEMAGEERAALELAARFGMSAQVVVGGALILTAPEGGDATERATRAAACALALAERDRSSTIALATGRAETSASTAGPLIDRAAALIAHAAAGRVALDDLSARLLEQRHEIHGVEGRYFLGAAREASAPARRLLGRPTPCVGRTKEIALLTATWSECVEESVARVVLVTANAGAGKTRLANELTGRVEGEAEILRGRADPVGAGSTAALARQLVRAASGRELSAARLRKHVEGLIADRERAAYVAEFLGELVGLPPIDPPSAPMSAARNDPRVMRAWIERSFVEWLEAMVKRRPVLVLLDDLQWGDRETVGYLDAALKKLAGAPIMVLVLARPEVHDTFSSLWPSARPHELKLDALTPGAAARLVRAVLGESAAADVVDRIVTHAAGNAFYLEELVRAVAERRDDTLPETVLAMVQARIDALEPEARRVLLAAAVFGEVCWESGIARVVADVSIERELSRWLDRLFDLELLEPRSSSRLPNEREIVFRHSLVREAAHATLPLTLRRDAHGRAAAWLEEAGEQDARVMVEHYAEAGEKERLRRWLVRAAEDAFAAGNLAAAGELGLRANEEGAEGEELARSFFVRALAAGWAGRMDEQLALSAQALELIELDRGLLARERNVWFTLVGGQLNSAASRGDAAGVDRWLAKLLANDRVQPTGPCAFAYYLAMSSLGRLGRRAGARTLITRLDALRDPSDPAFSGWRDAAIDGWERYFGHGIGRGLRAGDRASAAFDRIGDPLAQIFSGVVETMWRALAGQPDRAIATADRTNALATAAGTPYMVHFAEIWRSIALMDDQPEEALAILAPLSRAPNSFLSVPAQALFAQIAIGRRDHATARAQLALLEAAGAGCAQPAACAIRARLHLAEHDPAGAAREANAGLAIARSDGALVLSVIDLYRARLEALIHLPGDARSAVDETRAWIASTCEGMTADEERAFAATRARRSIDACLLALASS